MHRKHRVKLMVNVQNTHPLLFTHCPTPGTPTSVRGVGRATGDESETCLGMKQLLPHPFWSSWPANWNNDWVLRSCRVNTATGTAWEGFISYGIGAGFTLESASQSPRFVVFGIHFTSLISGLLLCKVINPSLGHPGCQVWINLFFWSRLYPSTQETEAEISFIWCHLGLYRENLVSQNQKWR